MPTYDYECQACHHAFERYQSMSARKLRTCPECGKPKLIRLVGAGAGVIFKGSGFYETDYKRAAAKKAGETTKKTSDAKSSDAKDASSSGSSATSPSASGAPGSKTDSNSKADAGSAKGSSSTGNGGKKT